MIFNGKRSKRCPVTLNSALAMRRRDHRRCRFTHACRRLRGVDDMYFHSRHLIDSQYHIVMKVRPLRDIVKTAILMPSDREDHRHEMPLEYQRNSRARYTRTGGSNIQANNPLTMRSYKQDIPRES